MKLKLADTEEIAEKSEEESGQTGMGFLEHLDELRNRIIYSVIAVAIACGTAGIFYTFLIEEILLKPAMNVGMKLQNLQPFGQVYLTFKIIMFSGITVSLPFVLFQLWKFIKPGLYPTEQRWARGITFFTFFCFIAGVLFAYYVMIPPMLSFDKSFGTSQIQNIIDVNKYWGMLSMVLLVAGIFFEMPVVSFILSRAGLLSPQFLRKYRRHAAVVFLVIAAIVTPSADPFNQMIFAVPLYGLYEISILISAIAVRKYLKSMDSIK